MLEAILYAAAPLIALTNPIAELPLFLKLVADRSQGEVLSAAVKVSVRVALVLTASALLGLRFLGLIGVELAAFRAAGGLLLIVMGMEMLQGREPILQSVDRGADDADDALWVPLVMPMLAGPGAITATVSLTIRDTLYMGWLPVATLIAVVLASVVVFAMLALSGILGRYLPRRVQGITARFSGLLLVAIGFQMGFMGAAEFWAGLS